MARKIITTTTAKLKVAAAARAQSLLADSEIEGSDAVVKALVILKDTIEDLINNDSTSDTKLTSTTTTAGAALPKAGGAMTGPITTDSTFDGKDVSTLATTAEAHTYVEANALALTAALTTNSTIAGVDIATRDGVLTSTTTTAGAALPKAGGAMTGPITTNSTFDGIDVGVDVAANTAKVGFVTTMPTATDGHTVSLSVVNSRGSYALVFTMVDSSGRSPVTKTGKINLA